MIRAHTARRSVGACELAVVRVGGSRDAAFGIKLEDVDVVVGLLRKICSCLIEGVEGRAAPAAISWSG